MKKILLFVLFCLHLSGEIVETFYGPIEVEEPVLLELIQSPAMQRLKKLHQYGIAYYTTHREEFYRFDHCTGVFTLLRKKGASLDEQIAGLLHDVSHTAFSHVGDYYFKNGNYQDEIHEWYLKKSGIEPILEKYGFQVESVLPKSERFSALEQKRPNLSADRIDYLLQGAYFQDFLTKEEAIELFDDFQFVDGNWISSKPHLLEKMARFSLFMSQDCWSSPVNYLTSQWLCEAIRRGIELGFVEPEEIHFGVDDDLWKKITGSADPLIQERMYQIFHPEEFFDLNGTEEIPMKFWGVDPWVRIEEEIVRLTAFSSAYRADYFSVQERRWAITLLFNEQGRSSIR